MDSEMNLPQNSRVPKDSTFRCCLRSLLSVIKTAFYTSFALLYSHYCSYYALQDSHETVVFR